MHRRLHFCQGDIPTVAHVRACGWGFAPFGCVVMVALPQTAPGVPAAGIDKKELQQIGDVAGILPWLASGSLVRTALVRVLGGGQPFLCGRPPFAAFGFRRAKLSATIRHRKLSMSRWCGVSRVYAWASLRTTRRAQLFTHPVGDWFSVVPGWGAGEEGLTTEEPRLKLSVVLDLALDSELARPLQAKVLEVHTSYIELRGAKSSEDIEPSLAYSSEHSIWNPVLGLRFQYYVAPTIERILTEGKTAKSGCVIALCSGSLVRQKPPAVHHISLDRRWLAGQAPVLVSLPRVSHCLVRIAAKAHFS